MGKASTITCGNVQLHGYWIPCEYRKKYRSIYILSLGDVDREDIPTIREPSALDSRTLTQAAESFYRLIPDGKRIAVLIPEEGVDQNLWRCRTFIKRDLDAKIVSPHF